VKAVVQSKLPEALAEAATVEWTVQDSAVRKVVTGGARTGDANMEPVVSATGVTEADGESDDAETTRRTRQAVGSRSGAAGRLDVQWAPQRCCHAMIVVTDTLTDVVVAGVASEQGKTLPRWSAAS